MAVNRKEHSIQPGTYPISYFNARAKTTKYRMTPMRRQMTVSPWSVTQQRKLALARRRMSHRIIRYLTRTDQSQIYTVSYHTLMMIFCSRTGPKRESPNIRSRQSDTRNLQTGESSTQKKTELMLLPLPSGMTHH